MIIATVVLAPRERQVLEGLAAGSTLSVVALDLKIRESTAASYLKMAKHKLHGVRETAAAIAVGYATRAITRPPLLESETLHLPPEQRDLVPLIARGMRAAQMATELNLPINDVRANGRELLVTLGAHNRNHVVTRAWQLQLLTADVVGEWLR
ncbi:LuxR C-terminal-related transcriptional regulator [Streptomyces sp. NPDC093109]|uniref:LuxR C-terminal-related transcriptional regulator n=1 Tax=Streptomyces sp. NPDC093109 TaxID=3154977 RepID=UPI00344CD85F